MAETDSFCIFEQHSPKVVQLVPQEYHSCTAIRCVFCKNKKLYSVYRSSKLKPLVCSHSSHKLTQSLLSSRITKEFKNNYKKTLNWRKHYKALHPEFPKNF